MCKTDASKECNHKKLLTDYPEIPLVDDEDSRHSATANEIRKIDALISLFLHIPHPEELPDELWAEKFCQIKWLAKKGLLGTKFEI